MSAARSRGVLALHGQPAGVVTRLAAGVIDYLISGVLVGVTYLAVTALRFATNPVGFSWPRTSWLALIVSGMAVLAVYLGLAWSASGKPLGGSIMGTRVVNRNGGRLGLALSFLRAVMVVAFPIGLFWSAVNPGGRSVQDIVLRTRVLYDHDIPAPPPPIWPEQ